MMELQKKFPVTSPENVLCDILQETMCCASHTPHFELNQTTHDKLANLFNARADDFSKSES